MSSIIVFIQTEMNGKQWLIGTDGTIHPEISIALKMTKNIKLILLCYSSPPDVPILINREV